VRPGARVRSLRAITALLSGARTPRLLRGAFYIRRVTSNTGKAHLTTLLASRRSLGLTHAPLASGLFRAETESFSRGQQGSGARCSALPHNRANRRLVNVSERRMTPARSLQGLRTAFMRCFRFSSVSGVAPRGREPAGLIRKYARPRRLSPAATQLESRAAREPTQQYRIRRAPRTPNDRLADFALHRSQMRPRDQNRQIQ
jgi:hypothetical protein